MSDLEKQLYDEITNILNEKIEQEDYETILLTITENIKLCIYSHQEDLIDFSKLKLSIDILLSIFYKSFQEDREVIYKLVESIALDYSGNPGTVIYFQLLSSRNGLIKRRITRQSSLKQN